MSTKGTVQGVIANMVTLKVDGPVAQNEICYIETGGDKLLCSAQAIYIGKLVSHISGQNIGQALYYELLPYLFILKRA